ncbi:MAG: rhomboid family intramembrane serine protease [Isosphaeraceae bacterium]
MENTTGSELATGPWEAFTLGMLAPLGPCPEVHLSPKIPPNVLTSALRSYLPLEGNELLLALIDGGVGLVGCCALTTRRVYWVAVQRDKTPNGPAKGGSAGATAGAKSSPGPDAKPICLAASYAALADTIVPVKGEDGLVRLDLGVGQLLALKTSDLRVAQLLARYLETVGAAARSGVVPSLDAIDPDLAARVARVLPAVASVTRQARTMNLDLVEFRRTLFAATPRVLMTPLLVLSCAAVSLGMYYAGVSPDRPAELLEWGANQGARVLLRGEYWRLFTSVFVHGGWIHLAVNMWCLINIGPLVERLYGNLAYIAIYMAAGIGGAIASASTQPRVSVGASGAIFGVLGALLSFLIIHRRSIPASVLKPLRGSAVGFVAFNTVFGMVVPNIDQSAHMGGLITGFLAGLLLSRSWPVVPSRWVAFRRVAMTALCAVALVVAALAATRRSETLVPPFIRYEDVVEQLAPASGEFDAIGAMLFKLDLAAARDDAASRRSCLVTIRDLTDRGARNLIRIRKATTPDAQLRALINVLERAQARQIDWLQAARRYLENGAAQDLEGAMLLQKAATEQAVDEFRRRQVLFFREHRLSASAESATP